MIQSNIGDWKDIIENVDFILVDIENITTPTVDQHH